MIHKNSGKTNYRETYLKQIYFESYLVHLNQNEINKKIEFVSKVIWLFDIHKKVHRMG